jgi:SAM-dependent methyltransferase
MGSVLHKAKSLKRWRDRRTIEQFLKVARPPDTTRAEEAFDTIQRRGKPVAEYGYTPSDLWRRAAERSVSLLELADLREPGAKVLELGAGDGMLGAALSAFGHDPVLVDEVDWRCPQAKTLTFVRTQTNDPLPFPANTFDAACSFNTFEHIPDPQSAFQNLVRLVKPGGWIYLHFGPLYASPWGLHAYRTLKMPYPQYLFSEAFIKRKLEALGIYDLGKQRRDLQFVNTCTVRDFEEMTCSRDLSTEIHRGHDRSQLAIVRAFPEAFQGRGLTYDDLVVNSLKIIARKTA